MSTSERRNQRSRETLKAINLQLQAVAERLEATAVWVADEDGLLLGASDTEVDSEILAAYSSLPWRLEQLPGDQMGMVALMEELQGANVTFKRFSVDGLGFTLGIARTAPDTDDETDDREEVGDQSERAITGVIRILAEGTTD